MLLALLILVLSLIVLAAVQYDFTTVLSVAGVNKGTPRTVSVSGGSDLAIREAIPIAANNLLAFTCDVSQLKALRIECDQIVTLYTNAASTGSPAQTIVLAANTPILWNSSSGLTNPLTTDITALYVTNASSAIANLQIDKLEDPTV